MLETITFNLTGNTRYAQMDGKDYLVAPMVMLTEGVHKGSNRPLFYPEEELAKTPAIWNMKPVVVYHPTRNGNALSACDADVIENQGVGMIMNTQWDPKKKKLRAEAWLDPDKLKKVDERVLEALEADEVMEVSTGLFTDNESMEGKHGDKFYSSIARNYRADHLAILPDKTGACSVKDGAGLLQLNEEGSGKVLDVLKSRGLNGDSKKWLETIIGNAARRMGAELLQNARSFDNIQRDLSDWVFQNHPEYSWVVDVYEGFFIYMLEGTLYKHDYESTDEGTEVKGEPVEVVRVTEYRTVDGAFVGNQSKSSKGDSKMDKNQLIQGLIDNEQTHWTEDDRATLNETSEVILKKMVPVENST